MTLFRSSGRPIGHAAPSEDGIIQGKFVMKDPQAPRLSNQEVARKQLVRTERPFFKHRPNCGKKIVRQGPSGPEIVK
jgi:hypothetical protein